MEPNAASTPRAAYVALVADLVSTSPATAGQMFGMPCLKVAGKAIAGFSRATGAMAFKLTGPAHAEALALPGARLFDPSGMGRPMKQWVEVPAAHVGRWPDLARAALQQMLDAAG